MLNATRYIQFYYILLKVLSDIRQEIQGRLYDEVIV
jgi:hypothetical protein